MNSLIYALRAQDFVVRHAAFQLFAHRQNPYDISLLRPLEQQIAGFDVNIPFLNPPWTLLLLSPVMQFSYEISALLWMICNVLFAILAVLLVWKAVLNKPPSPLQLLGSLFFLPGIFCLIWGQLGFLMAMGIACLILAEKRKSIALALTGILLLSVKPHLYFLLILFGLWRAVREKAFRLPLLSLLLFAILLLLCESISPGICGQWLHSSQSGIRDLQFLRSCNLPVILALFMSYGGRLSLLQLFAVPSITAVLLLCWLQISKPAMNNQLAITVILPLSMLMAPYSWHHDFAVLLPIQVLLLLEVDPDAHRDFQPKVWTRICWMNAAVSLQTYFAFRYITEFVWIPLFFLILGAIAWHSDWVQGRYVNLVR